MISVLMPAFNAGSVIEKTLNDFARQSFRDFELIIVDDGSEDNTAEIVSSFIRDNGLEWKLVSEGTNRGVSAARNRAFELSTGNFVIFCDCDDRFETDYLYKLHDRAIREQSDAVFCGLDIVDGDNRFIRNIKRSELLFTKEKTGLELLHRFLIKDKLTIQMGRILLRASILRKNNIRFDEGVNYGEDQLFTAITLFHSGKVTCMDDVLFHYVQWEGQQTKQPGALRNRAKVELGMFSTLLSFFEDNNASRNLIDVVDKYKIPHSAIKDLALALRSGEKETFRDSLSDPQYLDLIRRSQSFYCFKMKPETWLKGYLLLHKPDIFLARYLKEA